MEVVKNLQRYPKVTHLDVSTPSGDMVVTLAYWKGKENWEISFDSEYEGGDYKSMLRVMNFVRDVVAMYLKPGRTFTFFGVTKDIVDDIPEDLNEPMKDLRIGENDYIKYDIDKDRYILYNDGNSFLNWEEEEVDEVEYWNVDDIIYTDSRPLIQGLVKYNPEYRKLLKGFFGRDVLYQRLLDNLGVKYTLDPIDGVTVFTVE